MNFLRQSTAVDIAIGPFVDSGDGVTPETALSITQAETRLKKNNAAWAQVNDATSAVHEEEGWYEKELDATDTNTVGILIVAVYVTGALPVWFEFQVVEEAVYDAFYAASAPGLVGTAQTGDSFARLGAPAGASVSADIAAIEGQTDDIGAAGAGLTAVPWNASWDAEVQSEVADALAVYDPPTNAEMEARTIVSANYATAAALDAVDNFLDTEIAAILADTNELQTDWVDGGRLDLILDARASQTSVDDLPTNAELATSQAAADDATLAAIATLQTTANDIPTNAELATALGTADDAVLAAIAALNNLSAAAVNAEVDTAIADAFNFTAGSVDANVTHVIADPVQANGNTSTNWGGAP